MCTGPRPTICPCNEGSCMPEHMMIALDMQHQTELSVYTRAYICMPFRSLDRKIIFRLLIIIGSTGKGMEFS